jgi:putative ubiquitin-RnfH superfamily antitoxin RatB of RatAB toxin-antitoxin module
MKVSVVYALPDRQIVRELELSEGSTLIAALKESGLLEEFDIDPVTNPAGIYGRIVSGDARLNPGDRVEIYRPLGIEPKAARHQRSKKR